MDTAELKTKNENGLIEPSNQFVYDVKVFGDPVTEESKDSIPIMSMKCKYCDTYFAEPKAWKEHNQTHSGYRPYICIACGMTFRQDTELSMHSNYHVAVKNLVKESYPCGVCGKAFQSDKTIREHVLVHTDEWPVGCDLCSARFTHKVYLACHRNTFHSNNENIACTICSETFGSKTRQVAHMKREHKFIDRPHKCAECNNRYTRKYDLQLHIRNIHCRNITYPDVDDSNQNVFIKEEFHTTDDEIDNPTESEKIPDMKMIENDKENDELTEPIIQLVNIDEIKNISMENIDVRIKEEPEQRDDIFPSVKAEVKQSELRIESSDVTISTSNIETGDNIQLVYPECKQEDICKRSDDETSTIETTDIPIVKPMKHIRTRPTYKCSYCDKTFSRSSSVKEHEYIHTGENPYRCIDCDKSFRYATHYSSHLKIHITGVKLYNCEICGKNLSSKTRIKEHMRLHSNERPYKCELCNGRFISANHLSYHQRSVHMTGPPPNEYGCDYCNKTFSRCSSAREHQNVHTGAKPYLCNDCGKSYRYKTHFAHHLRIHANKGIRNLYQCNICSKSITTKHALTIHIRLHTNERPYACDLCDSREVSSRRLSDHKKMFHGANEGRVHKPFTHFCSLCDRKYRSIVALNFHMKKHDK